MQINGLGAVHGPQSVGGPHRSAPAAPTAPTRNDNYSGVDQLDISDKADMVSRVRELPDVRQDLVSRMKAEIASGTYDTDEKLDIALDRMLDEIG